jgi:DNA-binding HxlR family transcriptional regulator
VLPRTYDDQVCSIARALEVVGERWTLLLIRDAFLGVRRFQDFERSLGLSKKVLAERLERLTVEGILERHRYQERPPRDEYRLTPKGRGLWSVLAQLMMWGDAHYSPEAGPPRLLRHRDCGGTADGRLRCTQCGADLEGRDVELVAGPGLAASA